MKPILFNTEMVKAILDGRKTQTRRVFDFNKFLEKNINKNGEEYCNINNGKVEITYPIQGMPDGSGGIDTDYQTDNITNNISKYKVGDILYVRETWRLGYWNMDDGTVAIDYKIGKDKSLKFPQSDFFNKLVLKSCDELRSKNIFADENGNYHWEKYNSPLRWYASIHMPKELARIFLKVTNVRVERLQDISRKDVLSEGIREHAVNQFHPHTCLFETFWNSTAKDGYKYLDNPYVFVYEFEMVER